MGLPCVWECYEREVAAGSSRDSREIVLACGTECHLAEYPDDADNELPPRGLALLLDCTLATGPYATTDADAGSAPGCAEACIPGWR